jgi:hypothetical protein
MNRFCLLSGFDLNGTLIDNHSIKRRRAVSAQSSEDEQSGPLTALK